MKMLFRIFLIFLIIAGISVIVLSFFVAVFGFFEIGGEKTNKRVLSMHSRQLLSKPWILRGAKTLIEQYESFPPFSLSDYDTIKITYALNGLCLLDGKASELAFESSEGHRYALSLARFGKNCAEEEQTVDIPLSAFSVDGPAPVISFRASVWHPAEFHVRISRVILYDSGGSVLGFFTSRQESQKKKEFPGIFPLRPSPFAPYGSEEAGF